MKKTVIILAIIFLIIGISVAIQYKINDIQPDIPKVDSNETWIDNSIPNMTKEVASIVDKTVEDPSISTIKEKEVIYEDSVFEYYFDSIKSGYVIVTYADGTSENVYLALKHDRIKITDLTKFDIKFNKSIKKSENNSFFDN